ncbi:MAG: TGS domain-containing protein, partial [Hydrogenoanaerobacterium sp.]
MIKITLKGGTVKEYEAGVTAAEVAKDLGAGLYKAACAAKIGNKLVDLRTPITEDCELAILTFDDDEGKRAFWHTASHLMAQAVQNLFPAAQCTIGPAVDGGFFYDFAVEKPFTAEDLVKIEAEMKRIVKEGAELTRFELEPAEALELMKNNNPSIIPRNHKVEEALDSAVNKGDYSILES